MKNGEVNWSICEKTVLTILRSIIMYVWRNQRKLQKLFTLIVLSGLRYNGVNDWRMLTTIPRLSFSICRHSSKGKGKTFPMQAWTVILKLLSPQEAHEGCKVVGHTHRPPLPPENIPGTQICYRLSRPQCWHCSTN